ncbi:HD domain-containing protein [Rhizobium ruizarguesonis]|uniref:HD domain-containing protein n=1 Tax=Rhizobium ruizarguesonis TaxID=2081791 RepID=UPI0013D365ED|nr:HD domain-containing protein [Rhizobium ruizarguesonis]NEH81308.1 HD domain-containing protein [Rhizobium ruizarguesonis]
MTTADPYTTRINDPVHGTIFLSAVEREVIGARSYQRLHNVFQLGLTHLVFPGANYSRFAHSLGTCHISGRLLNAIQSNRPGALSDKDVQIYRLAALLHDIGHYPFSHSMEHAVNAHYPGQKFLTSDTDQADVSVGQPKEQFDGLDLDNEPASYDHELLGKRIITYDPEIKSILTRHGYPLEDVVQIFGNSKPGSLIHMVSSDLDCDRLDYLMRTAHHAGMPYGAVDIDYIVSQATIDDEGNFCFRQQALKAADHLLVSRFFDYQQVPFHKTVVAIELLLDDVLTQLFKAGAIQCSSSDMLKRISTGEWASFDDQHMIVLFRQYISATENQQKQPDLVAKIKAILERKPPKLIWSLEKLVPRDSSDASFAHKAIVERLETKKGAWAQETGVPVENWKVWKNSFSLTKMGSNFSLSSIKQGSDELERSRAIRLLQDRSSKGNTRSKTIMEFDQALMAPLSNQLYNAIRLYVLLDQSAPDYFELRAKVSEVVTRDLNDLMK